MSETIKQIHKAMSNVMKEIGVIGKGRENSFDHYKFRGIDDVYNAVQPAMVKHGVYCTPRILNCNQTTRQAQSGKDMMHTFITASFTFYASDGSFVISSTVGEAMDRGDKSACKAMSAAFKYALFQVFCIPTEGDDDTENQTPEIGKTQAKPATQTKKQEPKVRTWLDVCESNPNVKEDCKYLKLTKGQLNKLWATCKSKDPDDEFATIIAGKIEEQKEIEANM